MSLAPNRSISRSPLAAFIFHSFFKIRSVEFSINLWHFLLKYVGCF